MTGSVSAVFVDDDEEDRRYAQRLTTAGLECSAVVPPDELRSLVATIKERSKNGSCDIVLLDYRLDAKAVEPSGHRVSYRGAQAAAAIREKLPDLPLVLVTTEPKLRATLAHSPGLRALFDHEVLKKRLADRAERPQVVLELTELAVGFRRIRDSSRSDWSGIATLLGAGAEDLADVARSQLPVGVTGIGGWILDQLLEFAGPLVDADDAAARLGIAGSSFRRPEVQSAIEPMRYAGPFESWRVRWWTRDLERWLGSIRTDEDDPVEDNRSRAIARALKLSGHVIRSASCTWCGGRSVVRACSICREPVDGAHGLVLVTDRPHWAERPVACYSCVQAGRADGRPMQSGVEAVVGALKGGRLRPEAVDD